MFQYLFVLGRKKELSVAEIEAVFPNLEKRMETQFLLLASDKKIDSKQILKTLGGTIKIGNFLGIYLEKELVGFLTDFLNNKYPNIPKIKFALGTVNLPDRILAHLLPDVKKGLRKKDRAARFVNKNFKNLNLPVLKTEGFLRGKGSEIILARVGQKYLVAETVAIQDIDAYGLRDYKKPFRDAKMGMLPPKLAQIMLNLSQVKNGQTVWDPFCGSGTVLQEALLMECNVIGSDLSARNVEGTNQNLWWLQQKFGVKGKYKIFSQDVTQVFPQDLKVNAVVCEGFLGKPKKFLPAKRILVQEIASLEKLYQQFFSNLKPVLKPKTPIVIALPCFKEGHQYIFLENILAQIQTLGYDVADLGKNVRKSLIYDRKDQVVGREIFKFIKL